MKSIIFTQCVEAAMMFILLLFSLFMIPSDGSGQSRTASMCRSVFVFQCVLEYLMLGENWRVVVFVLHRHNHCAGAVQTCQRTSSQLLLVTQGQRKWNMLKEHHIVLPSQTPSPWVTEKESIISGPRGQVLHPLDPNTSTNLLTLPDPAHLIWIRQQLLILF